MSEERIGDMSMAEFQSLINRMIDERISRRLGPYKQQSTRPLAEILESMRRNIIKPAPGSPSVVDMLREDRER